MIQNTNPGWKLALVLLVAVFSFIYAVPNVFGEDPAIQISPKSNGELLSVEQVREILPDARRIELLDDSLLVRMSTTETQLAAKDAVQAKFPNQTVALNLAPATPRWLQVLGADPIKLGLDLRGGVHFLMEVDLEGAMNKRYESLINDLRNTLRDQKIRYQRIHLDVDTAVVQMEGDVKAAAAEVKKRIPDIETNVIGEALLVKLNQAATNTAKQSVVEQTVSTLRNRVNELGVSEAVVQRQGLNRVVVELPGIQDTARAKDILGKTATLEFLMEDETNDVNAATRGRVPAGSKLVYNRHGRPALLKKRQILTGDAITSAIVDSDRDGRPAVAIRTSGSDVALFKKITRQSVGKNMGVVYAETRVVEQGEGENIERVTETTEMLISLATIQQGLGNSFQITGLNFKEASDLALLLRAGAMPATVSIVEERVIGPSLGAENIRMGVTSVSVGLGLVLVFMGLYYSVFGIIANITLVLNLLLLAAVLSSIGAILTLPGIAGIVLTLGMAVDANVLIFERIREEMRRGMSPQAAIHAGFERAFATILDANVTTLIVGVILFTIGSGPVRGFAVTLCIGILTSLFTAITATRVMVNMVYGNRNNANLRVGI